MVNVLVVDDHLFAGTTISDSLTGRGFTCERVGTARDALALVSQWIPDVAVLDFDLGLGPSGIDLAHALRKVQPNIGVILLTSYRDIRLAGKGIPRVPSGTRIFCKQDLESMEILHQGILSVRELPLAGPGVKLVAAGPTSVLTDAQVEVLLALGSGMTTAAIARSREVSDSAIEKMISRIGESLNILKGSDSNVRVQLISTLNQLRTQSPPA